MPKCPNCGRKLTNTTSEWIEETGDFRLTKYYRCKHCFKNNKLYPVLVANRKSRTIIKGD